MMKKLFFVLSFFLVAGISADAQSCSKSKKACSKTCSKSKTASVDGTTTSVAAAYMEADAIADSNEAIEKRVCSKSGSVSYYEKAVCEKSGKVSFNEVKYCTDSKKFVNISPKDGKVMSASAVKTSTDGSTKKACTKEEMKACSKEEMKACSKMSKAECAKKCAAKKTGV